MFTSILSTVALTTALIFLISYIFNSNYEPSEYFTDERGNIILFILKNYNFISAVIILNLGLTARYYLTFTEDSSGIKFVDYLKNITGKQWSQYLSFLGILSILNLYPYPYDSEFFQGPLYNFLSIADSNNFAFWLYDILQLLVSIFAIIFAYFLNQKKNIGFVKPQNHFLRIILTVIITVSTIKSINVTLYYEINLYLGGLIKLIEIERLIGYLPILLSLIITTFALAAIAVTLCYPKNTLDIDHETNKVDRLDAL